MKTLSALTTSLLLLVLATSFLPDKEKENLKKENQALKAKIELLQKDNLKNDVSNKK